MNQRRHNPSSEVAHLIAEVRKLTTEQAYEIHGIEINPNKSVYDTAYDKTFNNVNEWAIFVVNQEIQDYDEDEEYIGKWNDDE